MEDTTSSLRAFSEDPDVPDIHPGIVLGGHIVLKFAQGVSRSQNLATALCT